MKIEIIRFINEAKPIKSMSKDESSSESGAKPPLFHNRNQGVTLWAETDKNGNTFLRVNLPLNLGSIPVFVNDSGYKALRDEFNDFTENLELES